jgi:transcriptional regulator with XRE-family HTH domain
LIANLSSNVLSPSEPETTLGERLQKARESAGLSLAMASHLAGVKPTTLRDWERDRSAPRVNKLVNLAGILGVSPTHLMAEEGQSDNPASTSRGRQEKLLNQLRAEISDIEAQQKALTARLGTAVKLLKKLK